jgi:hypothetical protein
VEWRSPARACWGHRPRDFRRYPNEIVAIYLGATALVDSFGGLGTVVFNADGHSGMFVTNDGKASGHFDCGAVPKPEQ